MSDILNSVPVAESVDLTAVSQQLDVLTAVEHTHLNAHFVLMGLIMGAVVALIIGRLWK